MPYGWTLPADLVVVLARCPPSASATHPPCYAVPPPFCVPAFNIPQSVSPLGNHTFNVDFRRVEVVCRSSSGSLSGCNIAVGGFYL